MFLIVDFLNIAYRSFFAIQSLSNSKGEATNAVYGFLNAMRRWIAELDPTHLAIVLDAEKPTRRLALLPEYKAQRPPTPELLPPQLKRLTEIFPLLGWPTAFDPQEEADDLGAALALMAAKAGHDVRIASNDKDFFQIVGPKIKVLRSTPKETVLADDAWVRGRWGIEPAQVADFLALQGDAVDNIRGVPGVGEKTATQLIQRFGSIEGMLKSLDQVERPKLRASLEVSRDLLRRNQQLIQLHSSREVPPLTDFRLQPPRYELLLEALSGLEFKMLLAHYTKESQHAASPSQGELF